jgi:hypothetical protein
VEKELSELRLPNVMGRAFLRPPSSDTDQVCTSACNCADGSVQWLCGYSFEFSLRALKASNPKPQSLALKASFSADAAAEADSAALSPGRGNSPDKLCMLSLSLSLSFVLPRAVPVLVPVSIPVTVAVPVSALVSVLDIASRHATSSQRAQQPRRAATSRR